MEQNKIFDLTNEPRDIGVELVNEVKDSPVLQGEVVEGAQLRQEAEYKRQEDLKNVRTKLDAIDGGPRTLNDLWGSRR